MQISRTDDLAVFLRVVDRGGFSAAARELHLTPSAVSKHVARLERELGVRLFERSTRSVRLTDEGQAAVAHVRSAVATLEGLTDAMAKSRGEIVGTVRITAPGPLGRSYLAPLIAQFRKQHPRVSFELHLSDRVIDLLQSDFDLAIRIGSLPDSTLVARRLASYHRILVASPAYLRERGAPTHPAQLAEHTCLVFAYPGSLQNVWSLQSKQRRAKVTVQGDLRSDSGEVLRDWCLAGLGISLREPWDVAAALRKRSLVRVLPRWHTEATSLYAVRAPRQPVPHRIAAFLAFLSERWKVPPWEAELPAERRTRSR